MFTSVYSEGAFYVAFGVSAFLFMVAFGAAAGLVARAIVVRSPGSYRYRVATACCGFLAGCLLSLALSTFSAFDLMAPGATLLLAALLWIAAAPLVTVCSAPTARLNAILARSMASELKTADDVEAAQRERVSASMPGGAGVGADRRWDARDPYVSTEVTRPDGSDAAHVAFFGSVVADGIAVAASTDASGAGSAALLSKRRVTAATGAPDAAQAASFGGISRSVPPPPPPPLSPTRESDSSELLAVWAPLRAALRCAGPLMRGVALDVMQRPVPHYATYFAGLLFSLAFVLLTHSACFCNQPKELTTWATRYSQPKACTPGAVCFQYVLVGANCSELVFVAHLVAAGAADAQQPRGFTVEVCPGDGCGAAAAGARIAFGWITPHGGLDEDRRFIGAAVVAGLTGGNAVRLRATFLLRDGTRAVAPRSILTRALPCDTPLGEETVFLGGGDYRVGGKGLAIVRRAVESYPTAAFFYIGGDLAYANNVRACYMRWDMFFTEILDALTRDSDGVLLPMLTAVGNHEGGGYLRARSFAQRQKTYEFYHRYFPHAYSSAVVPRRLDDVAAVQDTGAVPRELDPTTTFHAHAVGSQLGVVVLDSNIMHSVEAQVPFLRAALAELPAYTHKPHATAPNDSGSGSGSNGSAVPPPSAPTRRLLVVVYHNPAYPSEREFDDPISTSVRESIVPVLEEAAGAIGVVLEHHDHTYKRTKALRSGRAVDNAAIEAALGATSNHRGLVYIGDGALGVGASREADVGRWFLHDARSIDYYLAATVSSNGTLVVRAHDAKNAIVDTYTRRL